MVATVLEPSENRAADRTDANMGAAPSGADHMLTSKARIGELISTFGKENYHWQS